MRSDVGKYNRVEGVLNFIVARIFGESETSF